MEFKKLYSIWKATFPNIENEKIGQCFTKIIDAYRDSNRYYHNTNHLIEILKLIESVDVRPKDRLILTYTAFFHDVIYVPGSTSNELESSAFANVWMNQLPVDYDLIHPVCSMIEATYMHESEDELVQLFLDIDLSILGSDEKTYKKYVENIRQEHSNIPDIFFFRGRKKFVTNTLLKPFIFHTEEFHQKFESRARRNLYRELQNLLK